MSHRIRLAPVVIGRFRDYLRGGMGVGPSMV
jgi:hypothetical protein